MNNQKILISIVVLVILAGLMLWAYETQNNNQALNNSNLGTESTESSIRLAAGYVAGHITFGPNCPGPEKEGEPCVTPPSAYWEREVVVYDSDKVSVNVKGKIDAEGNYKIALGPGNYFVQIVPAGIKAGEKVPVTIKSFETSTVDFNIDTGMR
ncbi:hypothetical protein A2356_01960 [Candidatus Nomurabacteria bacterium RIFOXYB1_FULL_39_16]|uniref:Carboxypeptidase regulatory-like domain-containing protein n=2 Tax=Candidatus Nomuraibacteriota TaxID=1752729 RepID=A0A0G0T7Q0_9BACT|nr:MAG: hypothetical protein UT78_C0008G0017 [Candidatus Nomurabacteria bacterium GW2011_GWF2_40_12]OGJ09117.1 MAG: hypothetical protein A2356_01960 [Candidatus Nomurabacteria bacterium RIFOXYB1_FULL_39_16]